MSAKVKAIWNLYKHGRITKNQLKAKVPVVLTDEEYEQITGEKYGGTADAEQAEA